MYEPKTMNQMLAPMFWLNFLWGLGVFDCKQTKLSILMEYAYTASSLIAINTIGIYSRPYMEKYFIISTFELNRTMFQGLFFANVFVLNLLVSITRLNRQKLQAVVIQAEACDRKMENIGLPRKYRYLYMKQIKSLIFYAIFFSFFATVLYNWHFKEGTPAIIKCILTIIALTCLMVTYTCNITFSLYVKYLKMKFHQLNQLLSSMLTTTSDSPQHKRVLAMKYDFKNKKFTSFRNETVQGTNGNVNTIRAIKQIHLELIDIARSTNVAFGMQILLITLLSFTFTIGFLYVSYRFLWLNHSSKDFVLEIIPMSCWIVSTIWQIFYVNHVCAKTTTEAENIGDIICELYEPSTSKEFQSEIRDFTLQLIQNPLIFTACGFFNLGHAFIQAVIGSITTYLVIMIQVGDMAKIQFLNTTLDDVENQTFPSTEYSLN